MYFIITRFPKNQPTHNINILPISHLPIVMIQEPMVSAKPNVVKIDKTKAEHVEHKAAMDAKYKHHMKSMIPGVFIDADIDEEKAMQKAMQKAVNKAVKKAVKKVVKDVSSDSEEDVFS